jgi:tetratricopeptide (TPR) repeat protein
MSFAQNTQQRIDSLKKKIIALGETVDKAEGYNLIAWQYLDINLDLTKSYIDSSTQLYKKLNDTSGVEGNNYVYGVWSRKSGDFETALQYLEAHKKFAKRVKDTFNIANASYQKGVAFASQGNFEKSLDEYFEALHLFEHQNNKKSIGFVLNSIGIVQKNLQQYPQAIKSYKKSITIHEELNDLNNLSNAYANLGNVYALKEEFDNAYESYEKSLELDVKMKNNWGIAINYMDMATVLTKKNECNKALDLLQKALNIQQQNNFKKEKVETLLNIGKAHLCLENLDQSRQFFLRAMSNRPESKSVNQDIFFNLSEVYKRSGEFKEALENYKLYTTYKDSIYNEENLKNINSLQLKYETAKKDREIEGY